MFQPPPGLPADPQAALKQMQGQVSGFAAGGGGGMTLPNGAMMGGGAPSGASEPGQSGSIPAPGLATGAPLPNISSPQQPWGGGSNADGSASATLAGLIRPGMTMAPDAGFSGRTAMPPPGAAQPGSPLPPAVQAEVDAGRMDPAGARARVMANRPGFGGGQSPPIMAKPAQMPGKGPNTRGGGLAPGQGRSSINDEPHVNFPGGVPGGGTGGGILSGSLGGGRSPGAPRVPGGVTPFIPHEAPIPAPGPGGPNGLTAMSSPSSFSVMSGGDPSQAGQDQQPPLLPNGLPQAGINPAYQRQMMGAMRGMFQ